MPDGLARDLQDLFYDPQTSGGLLIAVGSTDADALRARSRGSRCAVLDRLAGLTKLSGQDS